MRRFRESGWFRFVYLPLALLYAATTLFWGRDELVRVYREYRQAAARSTVTYALELARREVAAGCAQATGGEDSPAYGACLQAAARATEIRGAVLGGELARERWRAGRKLLLFSGLVGVLMLALPLTLLYLLLAFIWVLPAHIRLRRE